MNFEEAKKLARETGVKICHKQFCRGEFFHYHNGQLCDEQNLLMSGWYRGEDWQIEGWSVYKTDDERLRELHAAGNTAISAAKIVGCAPNTAIKLWRELKHEKSTVQRN